MHLIKMSHIASHYFSKLYASRRTNKCIFMNACIGPTHKCQQMLLLPVYGGRRGGGDELPKKPHLSSLTFSNIIYLCRVFNYLCVVQIQIHIQICLADSQLFIARIQSMNCSLIKPVCVWRFYTAYSSDNPINIVAFPFISELFQYVMMLCI